MFTLGYAFRPWTGAESIAAGDAILDYIQETAAAYDVDRHIVYHSRVTRAEWSSGEAHWTVTVEHAESGELSTRTCGFLYLCSGYYRYDEGYTPTGLAARTSPAWSGCRPASTSTPTSIPPTSRGTSGCVSRPRATSSPPFAPGG